jgi:hypothetical protein
MNVSRRQGGGNSRGADEVDRYKEDRRRADDRKHAEEATRRRAEAEKLERDLERRGIGSTFDPTQSGSGGGNGGGGRAGNSGGSVRRTDDDADSGGGGGRGGAAGGSSGGSAGRQSSKASEGPTRLDLTNMNRLLTSPVPKGCDVVQCYIDRVKSGFKKMFPEYRLYLKEGDRFLLASKKRSQQKTSNYLISKNQNDLSRSGPSYMGKLRSNFLGTEFTIYDKGENPEQTGGKASDETRNELGIVAYASNVLGSRGPRKMRVALPRVVDGQREIQEEGVLMAKFKEKDHRDMFTMINKPPRWNDQVGAYVLNFNGRVTMASVKNFQLINPDDLETVILQFGRVGKDRFTMDFRHPLSPMQGTRRLYTDCICMLHNRPYVHRLCINTGTAEKHEGHAEGRRSDCGKG